MINTNFQDFETTFKCKENLKKALSLKNDIIFIYMFYNINGSSIILKTLIFIKLNGYKHMFKR